MTGDELRCILDDENLVKVWREKCNLRRAFQSFEK
jgi:hypothetical protein